MSDAENLQWDAFEQALLSIDSQVANLRAMLAALRDNKGDGRHERPLDLVEGSGRQGELWTCPEDDIW